MDIYEGGRGGLMDGMSREREGWLAQLSSAKLAGVIGSHFPSLNVMLNVKTIMTSSD